MKKLIALCAILMTSCGLHPLSPRIDRSDSGESVFRLEENVTVSTAPYCKDKAGDDQDKFEACMELIGETHEFGWTGTAWTVDQLPGRTFFMTAGHMCESGKTYKYEIANLGIDDNGDLTVVKKTLELPILKVEYKLHGADNTDYTGLTVTRDDDDIDLCELQAPGLIGRPLPIADSDPTVGDRCYYTGAPAGVWGNGIALTADMTFNGRADYFGEGHESLYFVGPAAGGASGSPIICDGQVQGVLVESSRRFDSLFGSTPWDLIRGFLRKSTPWRK